MIDLNKRKTLKAATCASAAVATPMWATTVFGGDNQLLEQSAAGTLANGISMRFAPVNKSRMRAVTIRNSSSEVATLKHVYPGVVKAGNYQYDINTILNDGPLVLHPHQSRMFFVHPVQEVALEQELPARSYAQPGNDGYNYANPQLYLA